MISYYRAPGILSFMKYCSMNDNSKYYQSVEILTFFPWINDDILSYMKYCMINNNSKCYQSANIFSSTWCHIFHIFFASSFIYWAIVACSIPLCRIVSIIERQYEFLLLMMYTIMIYYYLLLLVNSRVYIGTYSWWVVSIHRLRIESMAVIFKKIKNFHVYDVYKFVDRN